MWGTRSERIPDDMPLAKWARLNLSPIETNRKNRESILLNGRVFLSGQSWSR
jgi:hypothetical protein